MSLIRFLYLSEPGDEDRPVTMSVQDRAWLVVNAQYQHDEASSPSQPTRKAEGGRKDKKSRGVLGRPLQLQGDEEPGPEHGGACGAQGGVLALLSFLRTQGVRSQLPLSDDMIWIVAMMKLSSGWHARLQTALWHLPQTPQQRMDASVLFFSPGTPSFTQHVGTYWVGWQGSWSGSSLGKLLVD